MAKGLLWIGIGAVMVIFDLTVTPVFQLPITDSFAFPVAALAVIYGGLAIVSSRVAEGNALLTHEEVAQWAGPLEEATPRIIELSALQWSSEAIAEEVEKESRIPHDILIKYMYAMRHYLRGAAADSAAEERRNL